MKANSLRLNESLDLNLILYNSLELQLEAYIALKTIDASKQASFISVTNI